MSFLDKALEKAKEIKKEEKEKIKKDKMIEKENDKAVASLKILIDKTLNEFNGVKGITRKGNELYKKDVLIAKMNLQWETWENSNYDYSVEDSGYRIRWEVLNNGRTIMTGCDLNSFAKTIAIHLV